MGEIFNTELLIVGALFLFWMLLKAFSNSKNSEKIKKIYLLVVFVGLFILLSKRALVSDSIRYAERFHYLSSCSWKEFFAYDWEILYKIINRVIGFFTDDERIFLNIISVFSLIGPYVYIRNNSKNYMISCMFYVAIGSFGLNNYILRQSLALSFILVGIEFLKNKKVKYYIIFSVLAFLIHTSSVMSLLVLPIYYTKEENKPKIMLVIGIILFIFKNLIVQYLAKILDYEGYIGSVHGYANSGYVILAILILIMIAHLLIDKEKSIEKEDSIKMTESLVYSCIMLHILGTANAIIGRGADTFSDSTGILASYLVDNRRIENNKIIAVIEVIMIIAHAIFAPALNGFVFM